VERIPRDSPLLLAAGAAAPSAGTRLGAVATLSAPSDGRSQEEREERRSKEGEESDGDSFVFIVAIEKQYR